MEIYLVFISLMIAKFTKIINYCLMEIFESIGFIHFWGLTPAVNLIDKEDSKETLNVLLSGSSDLRHILKTITDLT